jgi:hypothetical protein
MGVWMGEVERPWVGMTAESMTDLERAKADVEESIEEIHASLARIPLRRIEAISAAALLTVVGALVALGVRSRLRHTSRG